MDRIVDGVMYDVHRRFFDRAAEVAQSATCLNARCGSVIVTQGHFVLSEGYNAPPLSREENRTCDKQYYRSKKPKYDLTCCVHAEWAAVLDAMNRYPGRLPGTVIYFMRIDEEGGFTDAGQPFCTTCSRLVMASGIARFALWNNGGVDLYRADEYDRESYAYHARKR